MKGIILIGAALISTGCCCVNSGLVEYRPQAVAIIAAPPLIVPVAPPRGVAAVAPPPTVTPAVYPLVKPVVIYRYPNGPVRYYTQGLDYF